MAIKIKLSKLLGERRMTQMDLSRKTGIRSATINEMYHELNPRINLEYIDIICDVLGCTLYDILEYEANDKKE